MSIIGDLRRANLREAAANHPDPAIRQRAFAGLLADFKAELTMLRGDVQVVRRPQEERRELR